MSLSFTLRIEHKAQHRGDGWHVSTITALALH